MVRTGGMLAMAGLVCNRNIVTGSVGGGSKCAATVAVAASGTSTVSLSNVNCVEVKTSTRVVVFSLPRDGGIVAVMTADPAPTAVISNDFVSDPAGISTKGGTVATPGSEDESCTRSVTGVGTLVVRLPEPTEQRDNCSDSGRRR